MNFSINNIITLENKNRYVILKQLDYLNDKYYFAMGVDDENQVIPSDIMFLSYDVVESYIDIVDDETIIKELVKIV